MCGIVEIALRAGERPVLDRIARMISDVPFGAFLSGGIESGLIIALIYRQGSNPVKTFTREFDETAFDEPRVVAVVARHPGYRYHCRALATFSLSPVERL